MSAKFLAFTLVLALASPAAARIRPAKVPAAIAVPDGFRPFFLGHALGTQDYVCLPSGAGHAWVLFTPVAELANGGGQQTATHFFSPNPVELGTVRPTWLSSKDSSKVWGKARASSSDPAFVAPGAIPWLLIDAAGTDMGANGGDRFTRTVFIQRVNTTGGAAPADGCAATADVGKRAYVDYSADYYFWAANDDGDEDD